MILWYDPDGQPIDDHIEWARLFFGTDRHVALDHVGDVEISTVWLGIDYGFGLAPAPLIYETMIFGGPYDQEQWRWSNRDAALAGHDQALALARDAARQETRG
jgi:hypothetical protein